MSRGKNWCFTLNNPEEHLPIPENWPDVKLCVYQREAGDLATEHFQGYVEFTKDKRLSTLKNINGHVHWEIRRGSRKQAIAYCMKEDTRVPGTEPVIIGELPNLDESEGTKKEKTSLLVKQLIDDGKSDKEIADNYFGYYLQSYRGITHYRLLSQQRRDFKTIVVVIYGPTGTGKSSWCYANTRQDQTFWKVKGQWWDGYNNEEVVILDEFYGWTKYDEMLRLLDRYPMTVEVKGGSIQFNSKLIIITSNKEPKDWYPNSPDISHLLRRIEHIWEKPKLDGDFIVKKGVGPAFLMNGFVELQHNDDSETNSENQELEVLNDLIELD